MKWIYPVILDGVLGSRSHSFCGWEIHQILEVAFRTQNALWFVVDEWVILSNLFIPQTDRLSGFPARMLFTDVDNPSVSCDFSAHDVPLMVVLTLIFEMTTTVNVPGIPLTTPMPLFCYQFLHRLLPRRWPKPQITVVFFRQLGATLRSLFDSKSPDPGTGFMCEVLGESRECSLDHLGSAVRTGPWLFSRQKLQKSEKGPSTVSDIQMSHQSWIILVPHQRWFTLVSLGAQPLFVGVAVVTNQLLFFYWESSLIHRIHKFKFSLGFMDGHPPTWTITVTSLMIK